MSDVDGSAPKRTISTSRTFEISDAAKDLIRGLVLPSSKKRMPIHKIKQHDFFKDLKWADVEKSRIKMPEVESRGPRSGMFDEIEPDSADEDFEHEYEELCNKHDAMHGSNDEDQFAHLEEKGSGKGKGN